MKKKTSKKDMRLLLNEKMINQTIKNVVNEKNYPKIKEIVIDLKNK